MNITVLGSGASVIRRGRRSTSLFVEANGQKLLFEAGWGVPEALLDANVDIQEIDHIFITHAHADHLGTLVPILQSIYVTGLHHLELKRTKPLLLHGYPGFKTDYEKLRSVMFPISEEDIDIRVNEYEEASFEIGEILVKTIEVPHSSKMRSIAFRVESEGKTIVYAGDCSYSKSLAQFARNVDLLVLEMTVSPSMHAKRGIVPGHLWTGECVEIAAEAGARKLLLAHLHDNWNSIPEVYNEIGTRFSGEVALAADGMKIVI